ncbi:DNA cytosine methyltransferase [Dokdonella koreensis]|uniref:DNA (cytosine-5-)-methyltransferase n=1 Tax=Dokdonella koreensis DS-123 TaxID=1300342 RepID=A0A160DSI7_9GAMM|nr:DNA (cytosine-5-)-methyltransferase [Dokdonella koreensis]ANB17235.1 DNA-cytosine methyltransferase [Dokdonella koreensis DS-123]
MNRAPTDRELRPDAHAQLSSNLSCEPVHLMRGPTPMGNHYVAGLFAGIGGVERGLARAGHETVLFCENDPAAMAVLRDRFPAIRLHDDVRTLQELPRETTLVVAGFPCQDLSQAGTTKGLAGARSGLVGEVFRLIEAARTPWVLLENVPFMLQLGRGEAMNVITSRLEVMGYRWAYRVVDSRAFGLPQRRRRVYLVASLEGDPRHVLFADEAGARADPILNGHPVACGFYWTEGLRGLGWAVDAVPTLKGGSALGIPSPPAIWMPDGILVTPDIRDGERLQGFPAGWTKAAEKVAKKGSRWKLVGNAVSVPAANWIGRRMRRPGHLLDFDVRSMHGHRHWPIAAWNVGEGRFAVAASEWPVSKAPPPLHAFLKHGVAPLSARATGGFLKRTRDAKLNFPPGFISAVERHLAAMSD